MPVVVFFLDALDPKECVDFLSDTKQGRVISGVPRVTPSVMGSFLTGKDPGEHGLVRPTPLYKPFMQRPKGDTIIDLVARRGRVFSYLMPFTMGINPPNSIIAQAGMGEEANIPYAVLMMPQVNFDMVTTEPERILHSFIDHVRNICATSRQLIRNNRADVYFISIREIDSFTHYCYQGDYRQRLIEYIAMELQEFSIMGNDMSILWWSDHGSCPKTGRFEINRWFIDKGYLKINYLEKRHKVMLDRLQEDGEKVYRDQVGVQTPFVEIEDGSKFVSADMFDSCVDVLGDVSDSEIEKLREELMATGHFKAVYRKYELFKNCNGDIPEIIPDRKDGLLVSGNVHPRAEAEDCVSVVSERTGDHAPYGCFGGNIDFKSDVGDIYPWDLHTIVDELTQDLKTESKVEALTPAEEAQILKGLERKGYA